MCFLFLMDINFLWCHILLTIWALDTKSVILICLDRFSWHWNFKWQFVWDLNYFTSIFLCTIWPRFHYTWLYRTIFLIIICKQFCSVYDGLFCCVIICYIILQLYIPTSSLKRQRTLILLYYPKRVRHYRLMVTFALQT